MRFCPFCSAENADELASCQACGRRLPPLPPRRARNAPPTGVQLPPRPPSTTAPPAPRRSVSMPPAMPVPTGSQPGVAPAPPPPALSAPFVPPPEVRRDSAPMLPPPPPVPLDRSLLDAISPGPAAQRREPVTEARSADPSVARRRSDQPSTPPPIARPASTTSPPPLAPRSAPITTPPPLAPRSAPITTPPPMPRPPVLATKPPLAGQGFDDDFNTALSAQPIQIDPRTGEPIRPAPPVIAATRREPTGVEPPPTRIQRPEALVDRPFTPPKVSAIPEIPEPGLVNSARYTVRFGRARWQRRGAIKTLGAEIKQDTDALDQVLGALGRVARNAKVEGRVFSAENAAITAAEERTGVLEREHSEVDGRKAEENSKFLEVERDRNTKLTEADRMLDESQRELASLEAQRRGARDKRKELERRQRAYLKAAEDNDRQSGGAQMGDSRQELRRSAEQHRREAAALEPERQEVDRRLASLEKPIGEVSVRVDAAKAELDAAKRSLNDAREGHTHRLAELDSEQKRKAREIVQAESEITRRLVTLGTLVNLNRIEDPQFGELYQRIDRLRTAITARTTEIEKLAAEREAYDRGTLVRGVSVIGGAIVAFIALIVILRAII
jgi:hypothetical protein